MRLPPNSCFVKPDNCCVKRNGKNVSSVANMLHHAVFYNFM